jgi:integrase
VALTTAHQDLLIDAASGPWCLSTYLDMDAGCGGRRGEVHALRWSDIEDGRVTIARSLSQTSRIVETSEEKQKKVHDVLTFKPTKTEEIRVLGLPPETLAALEVHRKKQAEFRKQFGADYRTDLDLIFANPDGTPLKPDSISATVSLVQTVEDSKTEGFRASSSSALAPVTHARARRAAAGGIAAVGSLLGTRHGRRIRTRDLQSG